MSEIKPVDVHKQPLYWGKPLSDLLDIELIQAYEYCLQAEAKREVAKSHPKFNVDREVDGRTVKKLKLPPINPNYHNLKNAITTEMNKRNLTL